MYHIDIQHVIYANAGSYGAEALGPTFTQTGRLDGPRRFRWSKLARNAVSFVVLSLALTFFVPNSASALVKSNEPFDSKKIPVELQAWWTPNYGHVHAGTRLPLGQTVSGILHLDVRVVLHNNPSTVTRVRIATENGTPSGYSKTVSFKCPYSGTGDVNCAFNVPFDLDTKLMKDGWRELRLAAKMTTPDGKEYFNSSGIPLNVQNGTSDSNYNRYCNNTSLIGRGWYTGFDYTNAIIECVPLKPISGIHTFRVRAQKPSEHLTVVLDRSHYIPAAGPYPEQPAQAGGDILFDQSGDFQSWQPITIDTKKLTNGWHTLGVSSTNPGGDTSTCSYCKGEFNQLQGAAKVWFYVAN